MCDLLQVYPSHSISRVERRLGRGSHICILFYKIFKNMERRTALYCAVIFTTLDREVRGNIGRICHSDSQLCIYCTAVTVAVCLHVVYIRYFMVRAHSLRVHRIVALQKDFVDLATRGRQQSGQYTWVVCSINRIRYMKVGLS